MDRKIIRYSFMTGLAIGAIAAVMVLTGNRNGGERAMTPEEVTETFCRAVASGEFDTAYGMCDSLAMSGYIEGCRGIWREIEENDSTTAAIARGILGGIVFTVDETSREGSSTKVFFTMTSPEGQDRAKTALLKKEEGEWKVERITDRQ